MTARSAGKTSTAKKAPASATAKKASAADLLAVRKEPAPERPAVRKAPPLDPGDGPGCSPGSTTTRTVLGAHPVRGGVVVRVLRPFAREVAVLVKGRRIVLHDDGDGLFSGLLPLLRKVPAYELRVRYDEGAGGTELEVQDPYRFLPSLGDLDLHLIGEGRHEELWKALGSRIMTHEGVTGTRFAVWAPNARGVRLTGAFTYWGTGLPMRSLGSTGVWELFVPGLGEGTVYKYDIARPDGSHTLRADPMARRTECPPNTASIVTESHHAWSDGEWMERRAPVRRTSRRCRCTRCTWLPGGRGSPTASWPSSCPRTCATSASRTWSSCRSPSTPSAARGATR